MTDEGNIAPTILEQSYKTAQLRAYAALKNAVPYLEHLSDVLPADDKGNPSDLLGEIQALLNLQRGES
ncbi:MAG: hypothetical protein KGZ69_11960 [Methylomonas sp.]|nr:hypothetical protein [Methylomonas sp.]